MKKNLQVLIVEDEDLVRELLVDMLEGEKYILNTANNLKSALSEVLKGQTDIVVTDLKMPGGDGFQLIREIKKNGFDLPVIAISGHLDKNHLLNVIKVGAFDFLAKPFKKDELVSALKRAESIRIYRFRSLLYERLVNNSSIGINIWHLEDFNDLGSFRLLAVNDILSKFTGLDMNQFIGKTMRESFPALLKTDLPEKYRNVLKNQIQLRLPDIEYGDENLKNNIYHVKAFPLDKDILGLNILLANETIEV